MDCAGRRSDGNSAPDPPDLCSGEAMIDLTFPGYRSFEAAPDDPYRVKWDAVRGTFSDPLESLNLTSVEDVNLVINTAVKYTAELRGEDVWQPPSVTWTLKRGDCEDYAILKYAMLMKAGIPARVVIGEIKSLSVPDGRDPHAWCAAYLDVTWRALDNKFDHLIKVSEYINWLPLSSKHDASVMLYAPGQTFSINERLGIA